MGLNIKNDETYRLVEELAKLTGETLTGAVTQAGLNDGARQGSAIKGAVYLQLIFPFAFQIAYPRSTFLKSAVNCSIGDNAM